MTQTKKTKVYISNQELIAYARLARNKSRPVLSGFKVGAALETMDGDIITGCNIETACMIICAERVALYKALSEGMKRFRRLAVIANHKEPISPCGICRQVLSETAPKLSIIMANTRGKFIETTLSELLPAAFHA